MPKIQKFAWGVGLAGLIPFVLPIILMWFVSQDTLNAIETMQFAYAGLIIIFMGGVQWGYAVRQGVSAHWVQILVSIIPTLIVFGILSFLPLFKPYQITFMFVVMLVLQAIFDQKTMIDIWFVKLRWVLTSVASIALLSMAIF